MDVGRIHRAAGAACEGGCTGFPLCREPRALGVDCNAIAIVNIARSDSDKKRKNDRCVNVKVALCAPDPHVAPSSSVPAATTGCSGGAYTQETANRRS